MKVIWAPNFIACGQRVGHSEKTEQFIIGYKAASSDGLYLISLADGSIITGPLPEDEMAEYLTTYGYLPVELFQTPGWRKARDGK